MNQLFSNERRSKQKHCGIPTKESAHKVNPYTIAFLKGLPSVEIKIGKERRSIKRKTKILGHKTVFT